MNTRYPPRSLRGMRAGAGACWKPNQDDQRSEVNAFAASEVRVFAARRTAESFTWVEVEVPGLCGEPGLPLMIVARRRR